MFSQIRRLLKHSAVYGVGHVLTRAVSFLLLPYITHTFTPQQYGAITLIYTFIAIAMVLYIYGFDVTFLRYYVMEKDEERRKNIFSTIFWTALVTSGVVTLIICFSTGWLGRLIFEDPASIGVNSRYLILLSAAILLVETLEVYPYLYLRSVEKSFPFIGLKIFGVIVHIALTILLISVFNRGICGIFEANLVASSLQLIALLPVILRNVRFRYLLNQMKEYLSFGLPAMPSQLFVMVIELANRKILEILMGLTIVGLFSAGYKLGLFMAVVVMGFRFAWHPFFLGLADKPDARETFSRVFTYFLLTTGTLFLTLTFTIEPLMTKPLPWLGTIIQERYWEGLKIFPIILLAHICNGAYANFIVGVYIKKKTSLMPLVTGVAALVNIAGNFLLIPIYGMEAAAWVTLLSYFTLAAMLYFLIRPHYPVNYEWNRIVRLFTCGALTYGISTLPLFQTYWYLKLLLIPLFFVLLKLANFFLPEEISAVRRRLFPLKNS
jgi:O-antigen/teichoic acid export membrane protein